MALNVRRSAVAYKLNLELHLISRDGFATYHARLTDAGPARRAVRSSRRQLSRANRFSSLVTKNGLVGHGQPPTGAANNIAFDDRMPCRTIGNWKND
jgi:hypothetical protein